MSDALEYIFPWTGGKEGIARALKVAAAVLTGNPYLIVAAYASAASETYASQNMPDPQVGKFTVRQAQPVRRYGVGCIRVSGPFALREAKGTVLHQIIALPEGPVDHYGKYWLHDDEVTLNGDGIVNPTDDGRYRADGVLAALNPAVKIQTRLGLETETAYAEPIADLPDIWSTNHRGDGCPSLYMRCRNGSLDKFQKQFPNGIPEPSVEAFYAAYDWRDEGQDRADPTTWTHTGNLVVWTVNVLWRRFGHDWTREIEPILDTLTEEADYADGAVPLLAGGTERRYAGGFFFEATTSEASVLATLADAMDGWIGKRKDGAILVRCGHYYEPTVIFGDEEVLGYSFDPGPTPEEKITQLSVSYTSPENAYSKVEVVHWGSEPTRIEPFYPIAAQSAATARRLAKRKFQKLNAARGTVRTRLSGRRGLGERYIGINISECADLSGVSVEVIDYEIDLLSSSILWTFVLADPDIDDWDPAEEEGEAPEGPPVVTPLPLPPPTIESIEVFYDDAGSPRLRITASGPDRDDLIWRIGYRLSGGAAFVESTASDIDPSTPVLLETGLVPQGSLEVIVGYQTGGGVLSWMDGADAVEVSTIAGPAAPTEVSAEVDGADVEVAWRNPGSANLHHCIVFRGLTAVFADSVAISTEQYPTGLLAMQTFTDTSPLVGDAYYWVVAYTEALDASEPGGPSMVTFGETETLALLATFTTPATDPRKVLINNLIAELKAGGIWTKLDALYVMAAADSQAARLNWINPAGASATPFNSPAFTVDRGYQGNGSTQYFQLGYGLASLTKGGVNSLMVATWVGSGGSGYSLGLTGGFTPTIRLDNGNGSTAGGLVNDSVALTFSTATAEGLTALNRSGSSAREVYRNGALQSSDTQASAGAFPAANLILLRDISSSGGGFSTHPLRAAAFGASLNGTEHAAFHAAIHTYLAAVGAA